MFIVQMELVYIMRIVSSVTIRLIKIIGNK